MDIYTRVTGKLPSIMPVCQQDITPYGNDLHHVNSIFQPACATDKPVVGVAITTEQMVAGCASGAYTQGKCHFYNEKEYTHLLELYGDMKRFQTK